MVWFARICCILFTLTGAIAATAPANNSVYTPLDLDRCRVLERIEEGESVRWRCPGFAGIPLLVGAGDGRFDVDAGIDNGEWESLAPFNHLGPRVEWRLRGRTPVAIIYRIVVDHPRPSARSALAVETIGRRGRPGCLAALIDGSRANANTLARAAADRSAGFRCGRDPVARSGVD